MKDTKSKKKRWRWFIFLILIALSYYTTARLGLTFAFEGTNASPVWMPSGIALAAILLAGSRVWPAIFIAALLANLQVLTVSELSFNSIFFLSIITATGNTLEALAGAWLISRFSNSPNPLETMKGTTLFIFIGALFATFIAALIGSLSFCVFTNHWVFFDYMLLNWWFGDTLGVLILAPIIINWNQRKFNEWTFLKFAELAGFIIVLGFTSYLIFFTIYNLIYLFIPVLLWSIFRFGKFETSFFVLIISGLAIWSSMHHNVNNALQQNESILVTQSFIGIVAITFLVLSSVIYERKKMQLSLYESLIKFQTLLENLPQKIFVKNSELFFVSCNENFARELNISAFEIEGKTDYDFFPKELAEKYRKEDFEFLQAGKPMETEECTIRDGQTYWTQLIKIPVKNKSGELIGLQGIFKDITERKQAEEKIKNSNRVFAFISEVNQMIVHLRDKDEVLKKVCQIAFEFGHFQMAWIGLVDEKTKLVNPVSFYGIEDGYLTKIPKISLSEEPAGQGPTGRAVRAGKHFVCNDIQNDPLMTPWRDEALKRNYLSSICLPIKMFGKVIGAFSLYAKTPYFFDAQETKLLNEVSGDISFAIESIETEQKRVRAEEELKQHKENLEVLVEERTAELELKNTELARMNKVFVGREIRMAELKKLIAEMELKNIK